MKFGLDKNVLIGKQFVSAKIGVPVQGLAITGNYRISRSVAKTITRVGGQLAAALKKS